MNKNKTNKIFFLTMIIIKYSNMNIYPLIFHLYIHDLSPFVYFFNKIIFSIYITNVFKTQLVINLEKLLIYS